MITLVTLRQLWSKLSDESLTRVFDDWNTMMGFEASLGATEAHLAEDLDTVRELLGTPNVVVSTQVEGICEGPIYFGFSTALALEIIGDLLMIPKQARAEKAKSELAEHEVEAFQEMANLLCGSSNMAFMRLKHDFRISQKVDHLRVWNGGTACEELAKTIEAERSFFVQREVLVGDEKHEMVLMVPLELATEVARQFFPEKARARQTG